LDTLPPDEPRQQEKQKNFAQMTHTCGKITFLFVLSTAIIVAVAQPIEVYFSQSVDTSLHIGIPPDGWNIRLDSLLAEYINSAEYSVDFCIYNVDGIVWEFLIPSISEAHSRGVKFRIILDYNIDYLEFFDLLDSMDIPYILGLPSRKMHIKMFLIDARDTDTTNDVVIISSSNLTEHNLLLDANNTVVIHWHTLARELLGQFAIYWGDTGDTPNPDNADFSDEYPDTIEHILYGSDAVLEVYFSPQKTYNEERIYEILSSVDYEMYFAINIFYYSARNFVTIMQDFFYNGGDLRGVFGGWNANQRYSVYLGMLGLADEDTLNWEIHPPVMADSLPSGGDLHSKYLIGDGRHPDSAPFVLTGSMNWARQGLHNNNECVLIIHNYEVAQKFLAEFATRYVEGGGDTLASIPELPAHNEKIVKIFPNPAFDVIDIYPPVAAKIYDLSGREIGEFPPPIDVRNLPCGIYFIRTGDDLHKIFIIK